MSIRGKEIYIIAGVVAIVIAVGWYLLLFSPVNAKLSKLDSDIAAKTAELGTAQATLERLQNAAKTAPQAEADLVWLQKAFPPSNNEATTVVELDRTCKESGVTLTSIAPTTEILKDLAPFGLQTITITVDGGYYDIEDFLHRLQSYVVHRNDTFRVTGRALSVSNLAIGPATQNLSTADDPTLTATAILDGYVWLASPITSTAGGK